MLQKKFPFSFGYCILLTILVSFSGIQSSCKKYPQGPFFSLRSKIDRLCNSWVIEEYLEDGQNKTDSFKLYYADFIWHYGADNSFDFYGKLNGTAWSRSGEWHFINAKSKIRLLNQASDSSYEMKIEKLMKAHLWLSQQDTASKIKREWKYKPKK